jgi:hypothetical protein
MEVSAAYHPSRSRERRTDEMEQISAAYLKCMVYQLGLNASKPEVDRGLDLYIEGDRFDDILTDTGTPLVPDPLTSEPQIRVQLKSTLNPQYSQDLRIIRYDLDVKTYNKMVKPAHRHAYVFLYVFHQPNCADWLQYAHRASAPTQINGQMFFYRMTGREPSSNQISQTIHFDIDNNLLTDHTLFKLMLNNACGELR